ncbi:MAG: Gfo/Idh/MocA family oxidoreductase [Bryobacteraceae bacterium]|nr:Gfo/Idh/MocA family oxidoreductase [Bryobacteraceae bacterium]
MFRVLPSGANDRITYGVIATGGRGRYLNRYFTKLGAQCVALCDVYEPNVELALKDTPGVKTYVDHKDLLAQQGVDTVIIAGPDHHHCPHLLDALAAGKDVYLEKPLSKSLEESVRMVTAVRKSKQVVQVGMQRRSAESIHKAQKLVDDGVLGLITMVKPQWHWNNAQPLDNSPLPGKLDWGRFLGSAKKRPLEPMRFRRWRWFWDYAGGNMTDQGTHLMDVVQWFTKSGGPPRSAVCQGFVAKNIGAEAPEVFSAVFEFEGFLTTWTLDYCNSYQDGWSITFMGDKGTMVLDEDGYRVWAEPWKKNPTPVYEEKAPVPIETHIQNFLDCVKSRQEPNCTVEIAAQAVAGPHLANLAYFNKRQMRLAPDGVKAF